MRASCLPVIVKNTWPRGTRIGPAIAPSFIRNASDATSGAGPRPLIGSSFAKNAESCTVRPRDFADGVEVGGTLDVVGERRRQLRHLRLRALVRELVGDLLAHFVEAAASPPASCRPP